MFSVRNYKSLEIDKLQKDLDEAPWHIVSAVEEIQDSVYIWETIFKEILETHIKRRKVKARSKSLHWINTENRGAMNQKYKYLKAAQANPDDSMLWDRYRIKGNCVKRMVRIAEAQHWISQIEESQIPKDFWKITNQILGKSKNTRTGPLQD